MWGPREQHGRAEASRAREAGVLPGAPESSFLRGVGDTPRQWGDEAGGQAVTAGEVSRGCCADVCPLPARRPGFRPPALRPWGRAAGPSTLSLRPHWTGRLLSRPTNGWGRPPGAPGSCPFPPEAGLEAGAAGGSALGGAASGSGLAGTARPCHTPGRRPPESLWGTGHLPLPGPRSVWVGGHLRECQPRVPPAPGGGAPGSDVGLCAPRANRPRSPLSPDAPHWKGLGCWAPAPAGCPIPPQLSLWCLHFGPLLAASAGGVPQALGGSRGGRCVLQPLPAPTSDPWALLCPCPRPAWALSQNPLHG